MCICHLYFKINCLKWRIIQSLCTRPALVLKTRESLVFSHDWRPHGPQSLKYLLFGPLRKSLMTPDLERCGFERWGWRKYQERYLEKRFWAWGCTEMLGDGTHWARAYRRRSHCGGGGELGQTGNSRRFWLFWVWDAARCPIGDVIKQLDIWIWN